MKLLGDADLDRLVPMKDAIRIVENAFRAKAKGELVAPPRHLVTFAHGHLAFTVGGQDVDRGPIGFRVYSQFEGETTGETQVTVVFDSRTGEILGGISGDRLGILRTGAIGGVALKHLARPASHRLGVLGSGAQAWAQVEAAVAQLPLQQVRVYSPNRAHRAKFAQRVSSTFGVDTAPLNSPQSVVDASDVVISSTTSSAPVIQAAWIRPGVHVTSMGPKTRSSHEIDTDLGLAADLIATDSPAQLRAYPEPHILDGSPAWSRIADLAEIVAGRVPGRADSSQISLFLSTGLAGTEVLVAAEALRRARSS
jgi:ornithine cyclodeaminase/alanine dehydrogenase-like protein (mu-crystallin family)